MFTWEDREPEDDYYVRDYDEPMYPDRPDPIQTEATADYEEDEE